MGISWKTYTKHNKIWSETTAKIRKKEDPADYFVKQAMEFDTDAFINKHRGNYESRGGLDLRGFYLDTVQKLLRTCNYWCEEAEAYMQACHKWHNRTYAAEGGLTAEVTGMEKSSIVINLYHSVPYGVYLELRGAKNQDASMLNGSPMRPYTHAGYIGIIPETIQEFAPKLTRDLQGIMNRV